MGLATRHPASGAFRSDRNLLHRQLTPKERRALSDKERVVLSIGKHIYTVSRIEGGRYAADVRKRGTGALLKSGPGLNDVFPSEAAATRFARRTLWQIYG
jgi:hypothetical protein